jgi:hypothetical protein
MGRVFLFQSFSPAFPIFNDRAYGKPEGGTDSSVGIPVFFVWLTLLPISKWKQIWGVEGQDSTICELYCQNHPRTAALKACPTPASESLSISGEQQRGPSAVFTNRCFLYRKFRQVHILGCHYCISFLRDLYQFCSMRPFPEFWETGPSWTLIKRVRCSVCSPILEVTCSMNRVPAACPIILWYLSKLQLQEFSRTSNLKDARRWESHPYNSGPPQ